MERLRRFTVEASSGGNIPTQIVSSAFTIRVTARDAYGNVVTAFNGAGNTVVITDTTGTIDDPVPPLVSGGIHGRGAGVTERDGDGAVVGDVITVTDSAGGLGTGWRRVHRTGSTWR